MTVYYLNLGRTIYREIWDLQKEINLFKQKNHCNDIIILNEHDHVYTLGKSGDKNHLLLNDDELLKRKISYYEIDRGGDLTYHGPGQIVVYPIFDLKNYYKDSHRFLRSLEEIIILTLKDFGIISYRDEQYTGVWVNDEKICAIGIKISRWITMHGLAFNVNNELDYFNNIIPCGIFHKGVTSMKKLLGKEFDFRLISSTVLKHFEDIFNITLKEITPEELQAIYNISITNRLSVSM